MKKYKYGLVLGGGGTRGFAHLGVLKALRERGIIPDIISGASAGSIVGALIADGKTEDEAFEFFKKKSIFEFSKFRFPRQGFFSLSGLRKNLEEFLSVHNIEDLSIPLYISVSNLYTGKAEYLNSGSVSDTVVASSSIPVLFTPVTIKNELYVDGGLVDNLPLKPLKDICEYIIVVSLIPVNENHKVNGIRSIISRIAEMVTNNNLNNEKADADLIIEPPELSKYEYLSSKRADKVFEIGYEYTKNIEIPFL
ncbi:MAG: patatin-like phospholipase family protein [Bacteroidota bacterium]|nr:patatin-like phospholipase family protein [Bacteroidota bacterium]